MIILPAIACSLAVVLVIIYEASYAYVEKRWIIFEKEMWALGYWCVVGAVLVCCKVLPLRPPGILHWAPFGVVVFVHMCALMSGASLVRRPGSPPPAPSDSHATTPPSDSKDQDLNSVKKTKQRT